MRKGADAPRGPRFVGELRLFKEKLGAIGGEAKVASESTCEGFAKLREWIELLVVKAGFMLEQTAFEQPDEANMASS